MDSRAECDGRPKKGTKRVGYMRKVRIVQTMSGNGAEKEHGWRQEIHGQSVGVPICFRLRVKCVSLDTGSIPPEINPWAPHPLNPHPTQYLHPPCLLKCVCLGVCICVCVSGFRVYVGWGSTCPVPQHLQGATEKTAVCLRETENVRKREWRANRHASQERHFWSEYTDSAVLCLTFFLLHSYCISCPVTIPVSSYDCMSL